MPKAVDFTGYKFGRLTVTGEVLPRGKQRRMHVKCDCGTVKEVYLTSLKTDTKSCGCLHKELCTTHGQSMTGNKLYRTWTNMRSRCNDPNHKFYADYGGRGVTVCTEWDSFEAFEQWALVSGYEEGLTIDRKNNGLLYSPEHCHWVNRTAQQRNRRSVRGSTSKYVGVSLTGNKWQASIKINRKQIRIGFFSTELEAAKARDSYVIVNNLQHFTMNNVL